MRPRIFVNPRPTTTTLEENLRHELDVLATQNGLSTSAYIRTILGEHIKTIETKKNAETPKKTKTYLTNSGLGSHAQHFHGMGAVSAIYEMASRVHMMQTLVFYFHIL